MMRRKYLIFLASIIFISFINFIVLNYVSAKDNEEENIFVELNTVLNLDGYLSSGEFSYNKESPDIVLEFNFETERARKNDFIFNIANEFEIRDDKTYITTSALSEIINKDISIDESGAIVLSSYFYEHSWTNMSNGLIAHAGGGILEIDGTNCYEAIVTNYNLGHRVFEIDFNLTSDGNLAAVHDWAGYSGVKSTAEWKNIKIADVFQSLMLEDILNIMMVNQDMILVTDTKSFEYTEEQTIQQFELIVNQAKAIDPSLLERIVPQIYNQNMYKLITDVYPFSSIIYTLYASPDNDAQVVEFVKNKPDIKVITMGPVRYSENFYNELTANDKYIYFFTLNNLDEVKGHIGNGIHGFYTDFITPEMIDKD